MKREELMKIDENGWRERGRVNVTQACRTVVMQDVCEENDRKKGEEGLPEKQKGVV